MTQAKNDKIAVVTGANRGIGAAISIALCRQGVHVYLGVRDPSSASGVLKQITDEGGSADLLEIDISQPESVTRAADHFSQVHQKLDVLINNAGILIDWNSRPETTPDEEMLETFNVNVVGAHRVIRAFIPHLERAAPSRIINMSSAAGQISTMGSWCAAYSISKAAMNALTLQYADTLKAKSIAVNSVSPGWVKTRMGGDNAPRSPEEGADTAVWLALDAPTDLTGQFLRDRKKVPW